VGLGRPVRESAEEERFRLLGLGSRGSLGDGKASLKSAEKSCTQRDIHMPIML
jgi:hypothetical protein